MAWLNGLERKAWQWAVFFCSATLLFLKFSIYSFSTVGLNQEAFFLFEKKRDRKTLLSMLVIKSAYEAYLGVGCFFFLLWTWTCLEKGSYVFRKNKDLFHHFRPAKIHFSPFVSAGQKTPGLRECSLGTYHVPVPNRIWTQMWVCPPSKLPAFHAGRSSEVQSVCGKYNILLAWV